MGVLFRGPDPPQNPELGFPCGFNPKKKVRAKTDMPTVVFMVPPKAKPLPAREFDSARFSEGNL